MKHAVILAHPKPTSLNAAIARQCVATLTALGHTVVLRDLYGMDFDPRLKAEEIPDGFSFRTSPDTQAERDILFGVDNFIFVYPFWFNGPPAILKGYIDRVFGLGFGTTAAIGHEEPRLTGSSLLSFSTSGAPDRWIKDTGALNTLMAMVDMHLSGVCGLKVIGHHHFGGVTPGMTEEAGSQILTDVDAHLRRDFAAA